MPNEVRGRLDNAIDRAVRGMMQVDPLPGLRHRVADRLDTPARRSWTAPAFATAAAILVLIVAVALFRTPETEHPIDAQVAIAPPAAPAPLTPAPTPTPQFRTTAEPTASVSAPRASGRLRPRASGSIFGTRTGRVSAANLTTDVPHADLEPAVVDPAAPAGGVTPLQPIRIAPIVVTPIRIEPLMLGPVRDRR